MKVLFLLIWAPYIIYFLESFLNCKMDDCMGGYDELTVWQRLKNKIGL